MRFNQRTTTALTSMPIDALINFEIRLTLARTFRLDQRSEGSGEKSSEHSPLTSCQHQRVRRTLALAHTRRQPVSLTRSMRALALESDCLRLGSSWTGASNILISQDNETSLALAREPRFPHPPRFLFRCGIVFC